MSEHKILVVDDDEALRHLVARRIERLDLDVDRAEDGAHALELIAKSDYDLIVTDIYMPDVTGIELMEAAKEKDHHTQVIVISASATVENAIEALNLGAFSYLTKPFDHVSAIDNAVSRALELRSLIHDNQRMVEELKQRAGKLEEEVSRRSQQISHERDAVTELLGVLPVGVMIVEEGGKVVLSTPMAKQLVEEELRTGRRSIKRFLEGVHKQASPEEETVRVGSKTVKLTSADVPNGKAKKRKVVVLQEQEDESIDPGSMLLEAVIRLKQSLLRLTQQPPEDEAIEHLRSMAGYVADLERFMGLEEGPSSSEILEALPPARRAKVPKTDQPGPPAEPPGDGVAAQPEAARAVSAPPDQDQAAGVAPETPETTASREQEPSGESQGAADAEPQRAAKSGSKKRAFQSGLLRKGAQLFGGAGSDGSQGSSESASNGQGHGSEPDREAEPVGGSGDTEGGP